VGGESGPGARLVEEDWVIDIREQCRKAGVAFFFKQWVVCRRAKMVGLSKDGPGTKCQLTRYWQFSENTNAAMKEIDAY
jgi:protein gp37